MNRQDVAAVSSFFNEQWSLYETIVDHDYLWHRGFYQRLRAHLEARTQPFQVWELGCGDARFSGPLLAGLPVRRYLGVDLAAEALERVRLADFQCPVELVQGNLLEVLGSRPCTTEVVLASYSVHHLSQTEKSALFARLARLLEPGGEFLLLDLKLKDCEDRPAYLERRHLYQRREWTALSERQLDLVREHELQADFPEQRETLADLAERAGLARPVALALDPADMAELLTFSRFD